MKRFLRTTIVLSIASLTGGWTDLQLCQRPVQPIRRPVQRPIQRPIRAPVNQYYYYNDDGTESSDPASGNDENTNAVYKIEWAEPGTLLLPPKVLAVGNTLVFPDAKYGKIIHFTNTELTLLIKEEEVKYPFKLKN